MGVSVKGLGAVDKKLTRLSKLGDNMLPVARNIAQYGQDIVEHYPPKPPQSKYKRTGDYGRSVGSQVGKSGSGVQARIFSQGVSYAKYLKFPHKKHTGRWPFLSDDAKKVESYAVEQVNDYVKRTIG